jgi:hypothetical protein
MSVQFDNIGDVKPKVTAGGKDKTKFVPNLNVSFFDDEFYFNLNRKDKVIKNEKAATASGKTSLGGIDTDIWYIDDKGRFKWDIEFASRPEINSWTWELKHTKSIEFYYQGALTEEEIADGCERPEEVVGSYAVYCNKAHNKYKTGKLCHIYRPFCYDAKGNTIYADLKIADGQLTITIDAGWLDSAVYPVRLDPTFGYTTKGGTSADGSIAAFFTRFTMPNSGDITSITAYSKVSASSNFKYALYSDKDGSDNITVLRGTAEASETSFDDWKELALTSNYSGEMSTVYSLGLMSSNANCVFYYDSGDANQEGFDYSGKTYAQMWVNCSCSFGGALKFSIYATYTESGGGTGNSYYYQQQQM